MGPFPLILIALMLIIKTGKFKFHLKLFIKGGIYIIGILESIDIFSARGRTLN